MRRRITRHLAFFDFILPFRAGRLSQNRTEICNLPDDRPGHTPQPLAHVCRRRPKERKGVQMRKTRKNRIGPPGVEPDLVHRAPYYISIPPFLIHAPPVFPLYPCILHCSKVLSGVSLESVGSLIYTRLCETPPFFRHTLLHGGGVPPTRKPCTILYPLPAQPRHYIAPPAPGRPVNLLYDCHDCLGLLEESLPIKQVRRGNRHYLNASTPPTPSIFNVIVAL